jgi:DNA-binding response OmpR family regulator
MNNTTKKRLLLVENDPDYRHSLHSLLELENFTVDEAESLEGATKKLNRNYDVVLADLRLSDEKDDYDLSGLEVAKKAYELEVPCILITAYPSVDVVRLALRSRGAEPLTEDVIPKAAGPQAVLDAINVVLSNQGENKKPIANDLLIDLDRKLIFYKGKSLDLSKNQYSLLSFLFGKQGAVCEPEELIKAVYGENISTEDLLADRRLEHLVDRVREKIETDPSNPKHLVNAHGRGFRLVINS